MITRRGFCAAGAAFMCSAGMSQAQEPEPIGYPDFDPNNFTLNIVEGFEPNSNGIPLSREIIICLDRSRSINQVEEQAAVQAVLLSLKDTHLLSNQICTGPIGIGFIAFQNNPRQLGYMVLNSPDDVDRVLPVVESIIPNERFSIASPAQGLLMARYMLSLSPLRNSLSGKRLVFLLGDEGEKLGYDPFSRSVELAVYENATTHCIEMGPAGHYSNIPTPEGVSYNEGLRRIPVTPGNRTQATSPEEIAAFILEKIAPNCNMSWNHSYSSFRAMMPV